MIHKPINKADDLQKIEVWFAKTYGSDKKSHDDVQLLILHKLYQLEERLKTIEYQTKMHWAN